LKPSFLKVRLITVLLVMSFAAVMVRLVYIQLWCHASMLKQSSQQVKKRGKAVLRRGDILDRNKAVLAESIELSSCFADPTLIDNPNEVSRQLSGILNIPKHEIEKNITSAKGYPESSLASHLLGYVGVDNMGLSGIEYVYNKILLDYVPPRWSFRDGRGFCIYTSSVESETIGSVRLTIDSTLQYVAERELKKGVARYGAKGGLVLIQNPNTGEILCSAAYPTIDLNSRKVPKTEDLLFLPVSWVFEPGSTFKSIVASAALEEKLLGLNDKIYCENGEWQFADIEINDHDSHKKISFKQIITDSSNIGVAKIGIRLGKERLYRYIRAFGFGTRTGVELYGESAGILRAPNRWSGVSLPVMSFGQELGVTPLQLISAYSAIANGGCLLEPHFVKNVINADGKCIKNFKPRVVRRVISRETATSVKDILEGAVENGTGYMARMDEWSVAGKTGTAQKIDPVTRCYGEKMYVASFCGFLPADSPELTMLVIFDEPKKNFWGGACAAPVFKEIARHIAAYLNIQPDKHKMPVEQAGTPNKLLEQTQLIKSGKIKT